MPVPAVVVLTATTAPSAIGATSATSSTTTEQIQLLANHQLADGAILGPGNSINPSFANLAAIGLARANDPTGNSVVYKWMQWYLGHLNATDAHGFKDTISQATAGSGRWSAAISSRTRRSPTSTTTRHRRASGSPTA